MHFRLGLNVRHADEQLRGTLMLPHGTGKEARVAVFAEGEKAQEAEEAGADVVGSADLAKRIEDGFTDFDVAIATPGPDGQRRPARPRARPARADAEPEDGHGHVRRRQGRARREGRQARVPHRPRRERPRPDRQEELRRARSCVENYAALVEEIVRAKPAAAKGRYIRQITITTTMGPGIHVDPARTRGIVEELAGSADADPPEQANRVRERLDARRRQPAAARQKPSRGGSERALAPRSGPPTRGLDRFRRR